MGNNRMLKILWSIVAVIFFGSVAFLTYSYFSTGDNKTTKVTNSSSTKEKNNSSTNKKESTSSTSEKDKATEENKDDSNSQNNEKKETTKSDSKTNNETDKKSEEKKNTSSSEKNNSSNEISKENLSGNGRTYEYNGRKLSPITGLGTTGKVFSSQKEALAYGQSEIERLVKEDKKPRQYAVGRVLYDDNSLAGWTVDVYEDTKKD